MEVYIHRHKATNFASQLAYKLPNGKARQVTIVEGGSCSDVSYVEKLREKQQQHAPLEEALRTYSYEVVSLT